MQLQKLHFHNFKALSGLFLNQEAITLIFLLKHWRKISNVYLNKNNTVFTQGLDLTSKQVENQLFKCKQYWIILLDIINISMISKCIKFNIM